jgi:protein-S-isoprenylcysteine O-methyltransferase Ste14
MAQEIPRTNESESKKTARIRRKALIVGLSVFLATFAVFFGAAGRFDLPMGWAFFGMYLLLMLIALRVVYDPGLVEERLHAKPDAKKWDKVVSTFYFIFSVAMIAVSGLDVGRFGWSPHIPLSLQLVASAFVACAFSFIMWAIMSNPFFSRVVRIQRDRGHCVVTSGPYKYVRHPGYAGSITFLICFPLMQGSLWAFIPSGLAILVNIIRTSLEDRTLQHELDGYKEYAQRVRYRLVPQVW